MSRRTEAIAWIALTAAALALRLYDLGDRPYHHDESQDAYFSWVFLERGDYEYNPLLHGPLRFYLTAAVFALAGDSDFTGRLAPALMGAAMVPLCLLLRPLTGRLAAFTAAVLLAAGPSYLYFSRFAREDIYIACITLALLAVTFRFLDRPRRWQPAVAGALVAASFATKESTFITLFVAGTFFLAWLAWDLRTGATHGLRARVMALGWEPLAWGIAAFLGVYLVTFTTFFTDPGHWDGLYEGLDYWLGQHDVGRGGESWTFYLVVLSGVEWPVLLLAAAGAIGVARRPTPLGLFLIWGFALSLAVYSWAGEKFAWLVLHPLLFAIVLAGLGLQVLWAARATVPGRAGLALAAVAAAYVVAASWSVNAVNRADPRELLVSTQSSEQVLGVRDEVLAASARIRAETGRAPSVTVDAAEGATFPWAWYFRALPGIGYLDLTGVPAPPDSEVLVLTEANRTRLAGALAGYDARRFPFRVWWVREPGALSAGGWWDWVTRREPWSPTGGMPEWLLIRRGA